MEPRANSYNLVPVRDFARTPSAPCPVRGGVVAGEGGRSLFVRLRDRMRLVRTSTADFSDAELARTKEALGQIYADVSTKLAPDDFARDLRKLAPSRECEPCPDRAACPGAWEATVGDPFTRDDARVVELMGELHGRVLDVGGGEGSHLARLGARAESIDYVGVDPDAQSLAVLAARASFATFAGARFVVGVAEQLPEGLGTFDHVLFVRSYNHLRDPVLALRGALRALRAGGTLLLVDNVAFGLVRSRAHAARAEGAAENRLEHYRNDGAVEADAAVREAARSLGRPLELVERRDVGPDTSNQWLLRYR